MVNLRQTLLGADKKWKRAALKQPRSQPEQLFFSNSNALNHTQKSRPFLPGWQYKYFSVVSDQNTSIN
jgi:hypothetical protein